MGKCTNSDREHLVATSCTIKETLVAIQYCIRHRQVPVSPRVQPTVFPAARLLSRKMSEGKKKYPNKSEHRYRTVCTREHCGRHGRTRKESEVSQWLCNRHAERTSIIGGTPSEPDWKSISETPARAETPDVAKKPRKQSEKRYSTVCTWGRGEGCKTRGRTRKESGVSSWLCDKHASNEGDSGEGPSNSYWQNEVEEQPVSETPDGHVHPCTGWESMDCWCGGSVYSCQCAAPFCDNPNHDAMAASDTYSSGA